jgi:RecB family endonuclease NucS
MQGRPYSGFLPVIAARLDTNPQRILMATEIKSWQIVEGQPTFVESSLIESGLKETTDLENWIVAKPEILGDDITIIGRQVQTNSGPLDLLAVDTRAMS